LIFHDNNGFANARPCYIYTYIACLLVIRDKFTVRAFQVKNLSLVNVPFAHYVISTSSRKYCYFAWYSTAEYSQDFGVRKLSC